MNNFWLGILERAIKALLNRIKKKKGKFDKKKAERVYDVLSQGVEALGKVIEEMN